MMSKGSESSIPVNKNLKRSFENAVRDIYEAGVAGHASRYRTPIVQRDKSTSSHSSGEKRALSDAASALAQLWRISPSSSR